MSMSLVMEVCVAVAGAGGVRQPELHQPQRGPPVWLECQEDSPARDQVSTGAQVRAGTQLSSLLNFRSMQELGRAPQLSSVQELLLL